MKVSVNLNSLSIKDENVQVSYSYTYFKEDFSDYIVKWRNDIQSDQIKRSISLIAYQLTFGYIG